MVEAHKPLPKLHVFGSQGEAYTEAAPTHLKGIAEMMDRIRSPVHVVYDGKKLYIGTRINTVALGPGTERSERYALFTEHDPEKTNVKDAIIRHFGAIGQFNENTGHYTLSQRAKAGVKLKEAYFDLANAKHGEQSYVGITKDVQQDNVPLDEFINALKKPAQVKLHGEAVRKILDAPAKDTVHASLKTSNAADIVDALAQVAQEHIRQKPGEPFEAAMPRLLQGSGRPHRTVSINPENLLSPLRSIARIDLETGEAVAPRPREPPAPEKKPGLFGWLRK